MKTKSRKLQHNRHEHHKGHCVPAAARNGVAAAVAAVMVQDYRVNRFAFCGFPAVSIEPAKNGVDVWISLDGHKAGPLFIEGGPAITLATDFLASGRYEADFLRAIQGLLIILEGLVRS